MLKRLYYVSNALLSFEISDITNGIDELSSNIP